MWIPSVQWTAVFISCLLCLAETAILRPYRRLKPETNTKGKVTIDNNGYPVSPAISSNFQPTQKRCCQIGERVAKKKMVCDITMLALVRKYKYEKQKDSNQYSNRPRKQSKKRGRRRRNKLSEKIAKCSAVYPRFFVKCCTYKQEFFKHLKKCKLKPKKQRRRCKQIIRRRYKS